VFAGVALTTLMAATWHMWRGGFNPPARFLVPVLPLLAIAAATALRARFTSGAALLIGFTVFAGLVGATQPRLVHRDRDGTAPMWRAAAGAEEWTRLLPGYVLADPDRHRLAGVWAVALVAAILARRPPTPARMAVACAALLAALGTASLLSKARTGGRDAVRLVGRSAVEVPGWHPSPCTHGEWGPEALGWGRLFEPHRHPAGAPLGERLALRPGSYRLAVWGESLGSGSAEAVLDVWPEGALVTLARRSTPFVGWSDGASADFAVASGERAVTLRLRGGGARLLRRIVLEVQPCGDGPV
jgi:hypothetical protein